VSDVGDLVGDDHVVLGIYHCLNVERWSHAVGQLFWFLKW
jgi:hypothetical protein